MGVLEPVPENNVNQDTKARRSDTSYESIYRTTDGREILSGTAVKPT